ncbi:MAG: hypothetical protein Kow0042_24520 [Calditrichia bacterium]
MKFYWKFTLFFTILVLLNCRQESDVGIPGHIGSQSIAGFWETTVAKERIVFMIEEGLRQPFRGIAVTFRDNRLVSEMELGKIQYANLQLTMVTNPKHQIVFRGRLDTTQQAINGQLFFKDGRTIDFNLKRSPKSDYHEFARIFRKHSDLPYKTVAELPEVVSPVPRQLELNPDIAGESYPDISLEESDILAVINRWHGTVFTRYENRTTALMLAFLLDPLTWEITNQWKEICRSLSSVEQKVEALNRWTTGNMAFTQADPQFAAMPGNDPWGTMENNEMPVFKKLIPPEMKAMRLYTGKISGKCFTLVNLITSCFLQMGVEANDILILVTRSGDARHAMALVDFENRILLVNLMMVDFLDKHIEKDFGIYHVMGMYNHRFAREVALELGNTDLQKIINRDEKTLVEKFANYFKVPAKGNSSRFDTNLSYSQPEFLRQKIFDNSHSQPQFLLSRYAYQSLQVPHREYYLSASLNTSAVKQLAHRLKTDSDVFGWIAAHIRYGSIFPDSPERLMTADQVLVFQQGGFKDQAVLAYTLLKHLGFNPVIKISETNGYICLDERIYDLRAHQFISNIPDKIRMALYES